MKSKSGVASPSACIAVTVATSVSREATTTMASAASTAFSRASAAADRVRPDSGSNSRTSIFRDPRICRAASRSTASATTYWGGDSAWMTWARIAEPSGPRNSTWRELIRWVSQLLSMSASRGGRYTDVRRTRPASPIGSRRAALKVGQAPGMPARGHDSELDDGADRLALVHQVEGLVDPLERQLVRDQADRCRSSCPCTSRRSSGTSVRPRAPPNAVPFQTRPVTSWNGRVAISLPGAGDADDDAHAPAAVAALQRLAHQRRRCRRTRSCSRRRRR